MKIKKKDVQEAYDILADIWNARAENGDWLIKPGTLNDRIGDVLNKLAYVYGATVYSAREGQ